MVVSHDAAKMDYGMLYEFSMSLDQVFGTVRKQAQLYSLYVKDALTAIYNRHGFYDELRNRIAKLACKRKNVVCGVGGSGFGSNSSMIIMDI